MGLLLGFLGLDTIGGGLAIGLLLFFICRCEVLALLIIYIAAQFEVEVGLGRRGSGGSAVSGWEMLASGNRRVGTGLEGLQTPWGVGNDSEVTGEWGTNVGRSGLRVDLE